MKSRDERKAGSAIGRKNYDVAIEIYYKALEEDEKDTTALHWIAQCYEWKNNFGQAVIFAERLLKIDPSNFEMLSLVGRYWSGKGDREKIYQFACRYIENQPELLPETPKSVYWVLSPFILIGKLFGENNIVESGNQTIIKRNKEMKEMLEWASRIKSQFESNR